MNMLEIGNVNKKMSFAKKGTKGRRQGKPLWERVLNGDLAKQALAAQLGAGVRNKRKIRKV